VYEHGYSGSYKYSELNGCRFPSCHENVGEYKHDHSGSYEGSESKTRGRSFADDEVDLKKYESPYPRRNPGSYESSYNRPHHTQIISQYEKPKNYYSKQSGRGAFKSTINPGIYSTQYATGVLYGGEKLYGYKMPSTNNQINARHISRYNGGYQSQYEGSNLGKYESVHIPPIEHRSEKYHFPRYHCSYPSQNAHLQKSKQGGQFKDKQTSNEEGYESSTPGNSDLNSNTSGSPKQEDRNIAAENVKHSKEFPLTTPPADIIIWDYVYCGCGLNYYNSKF